MTFPAHEYDWFKDPAARRYMESVMENKNDNASDKGMAKIHDLKTIQPYFNAVIDGRKTAELRKDDRNFQVGDLLKLQEYCPTNGYSGREVMRKITHVVRDYSLALVGGYAMLSIIPIEGEKDETGNDYGK